MNISKSVENIKAYEPLLMTLKAANELDVLRGRLKKYFEKFAEESLKIQMELDNANTPHDIYDKESEADRGENLCFQGYCEDKTC
jgi:hypothetical protein